MSIKSYSVISWLGYSNSNIAAKRSKELSFWRPRLVVLKYHFKSFSIINFHYANASYCFAHALLLWLSLYWSQGKNKFIILLIRLLLSLKLSQRTFFIMTSSFLGRTLKFLLLTFDWEFLLRFRLSRMQLQLFIILCHQTNIHLNSLHQFADF